MCRCLYRNIREQICMCDHCSVEPVMYVRVLMCVGTYTYSYMHVRKYINIYVRTYSISYGTFYTKMGLVDFIL